jgi:hypothetical protein
MILVDVGLRFRLGLFWGVVSRWRTPSPFVFTFIEFVVYRTPWFRFSMKKEAGERSLLF